MTTVYDTDPNTHTIAAAWSSSPLGDPETGPTELWESLDHAEECAPAAKPTSIVRHAALVAALACGIGAGAAFGLAVFDSTDSAPPTVVVPGVSAPDGGVTGANQPVPPPESVSRPGNGQVPQPILTARESAAGTNAAPTSDNGQGSADVGSPPAGGPGETAVIVDIPIPPLPNPASLPEQPKPQPKPKPQTTLQQKPATDPALQPAPPQVFTTAPKKPKLTLETTDPPAVGPKMQPTMQVPHKLQWPQP